MITVPGMVAALAESPRTADRHALLGNDPVTFAELHARAVARVDELASFGVGHGSIVAVLCYNETFVYEYLVAAGYLGAALMPLSPALTDHELHALVDKADAAVLMISPRAERSKAESLRSLVGRACHPVEPVASTGKTGPLPMPRADSTCWVSPTGGSTGTPRLFAISHERLLTNSMLNAYEWGWSRYAFHLAVSPIAHGIGFSHSVGQLASGGTVALVERYSVADAAHWLEQEPAWTAVVPTVVHDLLEYAGSTGTSLSGLHLAVCAGAPLSARLRDQLLNSGTERRLVEYYGSTELGWISWIEHRLGEPRNGLVGMPTLGSRVRVVDDSGREVPQGGVGRIEKYGRPYAIPLGGGSSAYEANASSWEGSGDVGYIDTDGALLIVGRADDMFVVGAQNVYPAEVENVIREHPAVSEVVVRGVDDVRLGHRVVAIVELHAGAPTGVPDELMGLCEARLAKYKRPSRVITLDTLPRNSAGKVARSFDLSTVLGQSA